MNDEPDEHEAPVSEWVEEVARASAVLGLRGAELEALRRRDEVAKAGRTGAGLAALAVALAAVFVFANWAAERALGTVLSGWRAPLVLAGAWLVVALVAAVVVLRAEPRLRHLRPSAPADPRAELAQRQAAFDEAQTALRESVEGLTGAIAKAAGKEVADAIVPDGIVDMGEGVMDAGDRAIEMVDEVTDDIEARIPGGMLVNRAFDVVLVPGRFGVRVARVVLRYGQPPEG